MLDPGPHLSQRALHATVWTFGSRLFGRLLGYGRIMVLARLLDPVDFGLMGVGFIVTLGLQVLTDPGLDESLIQKKGRIDKYLNVLWTVRIFCSFLIAGIMVLTAPWLANWLRAPDARLVMQAIAGATLIRGFANPGVLYFRKDLEFQKKVRQRSSAHRGRNGSSHFYRHNPSQCLGVGVRLFGRKYCSGNNILLEPFLSPTFQSAHGTGEGALCLWSVGIPVQGSELYFQPSR